MLTSTGQRITLGLLLTTIIFLLVMNIHLRVSQVNELPQSVSEPTMAKPEPQTLEPKEELSKPEKEIGSIKPKPETLKPEEENSKPAKEIHTTVDPKETKSEKCQPKNNIAFVKTVKTAGSTLTNILSRFAMKHNLRINGHERCLIPILLPRECPLQELQLNYSALGKSNIISDHILYNRTILSDVMPKNTVYVTQLRQPLSQLISRLNFRGYSSVVDPVEMYKTLIDLGAAGGSKYGKWDPWRQLNIPHNVTPQQFEFFLTQLEKEFDLVTITEQFDLSLLLLRRKLCWDISDMLYMKLKKANYQLFNNSVLVKKASLKKFNRRYQRANPNAYRLYEHFKKILSNLIIQEGPDLHQELIFFQELRENVTNYCSKFIEKIALDLQNVSFSFPFSDVFKIPASKWGKSHIVDPIDCAMMKIHWKTFQNISVAKQVDKDLLLKRIGGVASEENKRIYFSLTEPIHPKYGIPLPVLKHARAYDLNEAVYIRGKWVQSTWNTWIRKLKKTKQNGNVIQ